MSSEGLCPDAVIGSGKRTRRLEMDLERLTDLTDLKSNTQVIEIAEYTACSLFASSQGGGKEGFKVETGFSSQSLTVFSRGGTMLCGGAKKKQWRLLRT